VIEKCKHAARRHDCPKMVYEGKQLVLVMSDEGCAVVSFIVEFFVVPLVHRGNTG
jgi:hypothetical protein